MNNDYTISGMDALEFDRYLDLLADTHYEDTEEEQGLQGLPTGGKHSPSRGYYDYLSTLEDSQAKYWII